MVPEPAPTPPPEKKVEAPPPPPKPSPKPPEPKPAKPAFDPNALSALLNKRVQQNAPPSPQQETQPNPQAPPVVASSRGSSEPLTISEIDLIRRQIERCWNPPLGAKDAQDLVIRARVQLNPDGSLNVLTGQVDIAGTNISLAQIAATAFGVDFDQVKITTGDTDTAPLTGLSAGSKTIYTVGSAVLKAAEDARRQTLEIAAKELEASIHDLEIRDNKVVVKGAPDKSVTLASIGKKGNLYMSKVPPVLGTATPAFSQQAPGFCAQIARVEVDPDTGETTLHDFVVIQDPGGAALALWQKVG